MSQPATLSLSTRDVIHIEGFQENASLFKNESTLRIRTILQQLQTACTASGMGLAEVNALMQQGIPCEVLQPGADDWQVGTIRLSLEFQRGSLSASSMANTVTIQSDIQPDIQPSIQSNAVTAAVLPAAIVDPVVLEADLGLESEASLDSGLMDDLDDTFGDELVMDALDDVSLKGDELLGMMPDASESVDSDLDLAGLSAMDELSDGLGHDLGSDDLSFDLDSQAVNAEDLEGLGDLTSPWDLSDDLDEMLLKNNSL